jgi:prepilin-type N-terminal cleavage/methylation domain-containing protein
MMERGFTLLEMLVTISLLTMIILVGTSSYGLVAQRWDGQIGKFDKRIQSARDLMLVQDVLETIVPYIAYGNDNKPGIFFEGNRNGFVGVSTKSIFNKNYHSIFRLSVIQRADLTYDVLYEESPMVSDVLRSTREKVIFSERLVMFSAVKNPSFEYFGWNSVQDKSGVEGSIPPKPAQWLSSYNAMDLPFPPEKIRFSFDNKDGSYEVRASISQGKIGLVSMYSGSRTRERDENGEILKPGDICYC